MAISIESAYEPTYCTVAQIKAILTLSDDEATALILKAEQVVDLLVGYHDKYYWQFSKDSADWQDQKTIFPRIQDTKIENDIEVPFIPYNIHRACLLIAEALNIINEKEANAQVLDDMLLGGDSAKLGDFAISKKKVDKTGDKALSFREELIEKLKTTSQGKEGLVFLNDYSNFAFITL